MKFKKIYIEITNVCNLSCSFCNSSNRVKKEMTPSEFEVVLKHIGNYTEYIYLHVDTIYSLNFLRISSSSFIFSPCSKAALARGRPCNALQGLRRAVWREDHHYGRS